MIIDRKFNIDAVNPCNGNKYTEEDSILLCAKDRGVVWALRAYWLACFFLKCHKEHLQSISLLIDRVKWFQKHLGSRKPDTHLDCEIERCIEGKNLNLERVGRNN